MISRFLAMTDEARVRLVVWLYHRYVVRPYIKEQARLAEELAELFEDEIEIVWEPEEDLPTIH